MSLHIKEMKSSLLISKNIKIFFIVETIDDRSYYLRICGFMLVLFCNLRVGIRKIRTCRSFDVLPISAAQLPLYLAIHRDFRV